MFRVRLDRKKSVESVLTITSEFAFKVWISSMTWASWLKSGDSEWSPFPEKKPSVRSEQDELIDKNGSRIAFFEDRLYNLFTSLLLDSRVQLHTHTYTPFLGRHAELFESFDWNDLKALRWLLTPRWRPIAVCFKLCLTDLIRCCARMCPVRACQPSKRSSVKDRRREGRPG